MSKRSAVAVWLVAAVFAAQAIGALGTLTGCTLAREYQPIDGCVELGKVIDDLMLKAAAVLHLWSGRGKGTPPVAPGRGESRP